MEMNIICDVVKADALFNHERTEPSRVGALKERIGEEGVRDPVIVDDKTHVVLDGAHRVAALKELNAWVPVQKVDYFSPSVRLAFWYPRLTPFILKRMGELGLESTTKKRAFELLSSLSALFSFFYKGKWYVCGKGYYEVKELFDLQTAVLEGARYVRGRRGVLFRKEFSKKEIIRFARTRTLMPPKYTRHIVRGRLLSLNIPFEFLKNRKRALGFIKKRLSTSFKRFYEESTVVLY